MKEAKKATDSVSMEKTADIVKEAKRTAVSVSVKEAKRAAVSVSLKEAKKAAVPVSM